jgi:hypothetical protein
MGVRGVTSLSVCRGGLGERENADRERDGAEREREHLGFRV